MSSRVASEDGGTPGLLGQALAQPAEEDTALEGALPGTPARRVGHQERHTAADLLARRAEDIPGTSCAAVPNGAFLAFVLRAPNTLRDATLRGHGLPVGAYPSRREELAAVADMDLVIPARRAGHGGGGGGHPRPPQTPYAEPSFPSMWATPRCWIPRGASPGLSGRTLWGPTPASPRAMRRGW